MSSRPLDSILVVYIRGSLKMAPIAVGDTIPDGVLSYLDEDNTSQKFHVHEELKGKKVVLLAVPGAFTPTCRYLSLSVSISLWRSFWRASLGGKCLVGLSCRGVAWGSKGNFGFFVFLVIFLKCRGMWDFVGFGCFDGGDVFVCCFPEGFVESYLVRESLVGLSSRGGVL